MIDFDERIETASIRVGTLAMDEEINEQTNNYALSYIDSDNQTVTLASGLDVLTLLSAMRGNARIITPINAEDIGTVDLTAVETYCRFLFTEWWARRKGTYGWLDEALNRTDYDPLENYDRREEGGWSDTDALGEHVTTDNTSHVNVARTDTVVETPRAESTTTSMPGVIVTTENDVYGYNSSTEVPAGKSTVTPDATTPDVVKVAGTDGTNTVKTDFGAHTDQDNRTITADEATDTHTRLYDDYRVHGNIGVSTVADMLGKEVELRRPIDLVRFALNEWLDLYTVYIN